MTGPDGVLVIDIEAITRRREELMRRRDDILQRNDAALAALESANGFGAKLLAVGHLASIRREAQSLTAEIEQTQIAIDEANVELERMAGRGHPWPAKQK